mgnify:CR=1 FL=1
MTKLTETYLNMRKGSISEDDQSNAEYWNQEAERNRRQGGKPLPNEWNIFGPKDTPAPKAAPPKPNKPNK